MILARATDRAYVPGTVAAPWCLPARLGNCPVPARTPAAAHSVHTGGGGVGQPGTPRPRRPTAGARQATPVNQGAPGRLRRRGPAWPTGPVPLLRAAGRRPP